MAAERRLAAGAGDIGKLEVMCDLLFILARATEDSGRMRRRVALGRPAQEGLLGAEVHAPQASERGVGHGGKGEDRDPAEGAGRGRLWRQGAAVAHPPEVSQANSWIKTHKKTEIQILK